MRTPKINSLLIGLLFCVAIVAGCATSHMRPQGGDSIVVEDLLRLPLLEGRVGYEKLVASLEDSPVQQERISRPDVPPRLRNAGGRLRLKEGFFIESVQVGEGAGANIRIAAQPCFTVERAAAISGVKIAPPYLSLEEDGRIVRPFTARSDEVTVTFATAAPEYRCVVSVSIYVV